MTETGRNSDEGLPDSTDRTKLVDYLIIGSGLSGITLKHFLKSERVVILDPNPGGYKIGESIVPETFRHPELNSLLEGIRGLPSYSAKVGTTFVSDGTIASFPIPTKGHEFSMHVARSELEQLMVEHWGIPINQERVRHIDIATKTVRTNVCTYRVEKQIIDCSGPAMVLARALDEVIESRPVFATWAYFDVLENTASKFWGFVRETNKQYARYNIPLNRVLPEQEDDDWDPSSSTVLTQISEGLWSWQIPLYNKSLLSFGIVSREKKVSKEQLLDYAEKNHLSNYTLRPHEGVSPTPYTRVHTRNRFANRIKTPATMDYVVLGDAFAFSDPIYSIGSGLAVNKAIELAGLLNDGGWSKDKCSNWCEKLERLFERCENAFDFWYSGEVLTNDEAACEVQENFLLGNAFQVGIATAYGGMLQETGPKESLTLNFNSSKAARIRDETSSQVAALLELTDGRTLANWTYGGAIPVINGVQHRWLRKKMPDLIITTEFSADRGQYFRRIGNITLSFMDLCEGSYPMDDSGHALFDALEAAIQRRPEDWKALRHILPTCEGDTGG